MQVATIQVPLGTKRAFTLAEVLVACGIVALLVMTNMAAVYQMRLMSAKDAERGLPDWDLPRMSAAARYEDVRSSAAFPLRRLTCPPN